MPTAVRVDSMTDRSLEELAKARGQKKAVIVKEAVEEFRKKVFFAELRNDFEALKNDRAAWDEELQDRKVWDATLADGLDQE